MSKKFAMFMIAVVLIVLCGTASAQGPQNDVTTVSYNGIEFRYVPEAFGAVLPIRDEGTPYQTDAPYFANVAPHTSFQFLRPDPARPDTNLRGELAVYRISDIETYAEPSYRQVVEQLLSLNTDDLSAYATVGADYTIPALPFMPVLNATQVFRAHPVGINSETARGIEYITYYTQAAEPILDGQVFYTYQAITTDGLNYLSLSMPVETGLLGTSIPADFDWDAFNANYAQYLQDTFAVINYADPMTFTPTKAEFHRFIESISIDQ